MSCFPCFSSRKSKKSSSRVLHVVAHASIDPGDESPLPGFGKEKQSPEAENGKDAASTDNTGNIAAHTFTFRELASATKNFRKECLLGEGGFGKVFKGTLPNSEQVVAVKQLDRNGTQGNKEFLVEVLMLSLLHHPNLVSLVGYCADGEQRLLVYEYMPLGSLEATLFETSSENNPLDWSTRMKIASGAAQGLEYLHQKANPPVIYRDLKPSNILLDEDFNPKLSDFGLAKLGQSGNKMHISPRVIGHGYSAPEYERTGELTLKSDMYNFGVVLLELITGRKAIDTTKQSEEQNLVTWAQPIFKDPKRFPEMADPLLKLNFPVRSLNQAIGVAAMCLQEEPSVRPLISDVVAALTSITEVKDEPDLSSLLASEINKSSDEYSSEDDHYGSLTDPKDEGISSNGHMDSSDHNGESQKQVKKSIRWSSDVERKHKDTSDGSFNSNSRRISNMETQDTSSISNSSQNIMMEPQDTSSDSIPKSSNDMESWDISVDSNTRHKSEDPKAR